MGGNGEVCGSREAVQKTKRYRRRVREPGGTKHTSTRDDCNSGEKQGQKSIAMGTTAARGYILCSTQFNKRKTLEKIEKILKILITSISSIHYRIGNVYENKLQ